MNAADVRKTTEQKMHKSVEALKQDLGKVRTGRAHTGLLDHVMVDYYGNPTPIQQIGSVSLLDARTLAVTPWEKKLLSAVEKASGVSSTVSWKPCSRTSSPASRARLPAGTPSRSCSL